MLFIKSNPLDVNKLTGTQQLYLSDSWINPTEMKVWPPKKHAYALYKKFPFS